MARITYTEHTTTGSPFPGNLDLTVASNGEKAVYLDDTSGSTLTLVGRNLVEDPGTENTFSSGRVDKVVVRNSDGDTLYKITDADFRAKALGDAYLASGSGALIDKMFTGDDIIIGSDAADDLSGLKGDDRINGGKGKDDIWGGRGDDRLTGGGGSDFFQFVTMEDGKFNDVITDLDIEGAVTDSLYIDIDFRATRANGGDDTLLKLDNGGTILLKDVAKADFVDWWEVPT